MLWSIRVKGGAGGVSAVRNTQDKDYPVPPTERWVHAGRRSMSGTERRKEALSQTKNALTSAPILGPGEVFAPGTSKESGTFRLG